MTRTRPAWCRRKSNKKTAKATTGTKTTQRGPRKKIVTLAQYEADPQTQQPAGATAEAPAGPTTETAIDNDKKKRSSGLDAVARVLRESGTPMSTGEMVKAALEKGYWQTGGKTPAATIYSAIVREITVKGDKSRFRKTDRGHFELTEAGKQVD